MTAPPPGAAIRVVLTKWGDRPHWVIPGTLLGADAHGDWLAFPAGTRMARPGRSFDSPNHQVGLVPASGAWLATFHAPGGDVDCYVDMTTAPRWRGADVVAVDLDLDVIRGLDGEVVIDDEDEFADHRREYGYPDDVVALATGTSVEIADAMRARRPPFDGLAHLTWLERVGG